MEVLRELKKHFEIILFTSSSKMYCDLLIDSTIEKDEKFFDFKLYGQHCAKDSQTGISKDLEILLSGRNLDDIVIIDDRVENFKR
jgi:TFIIF-interacting CTD phosphatase-like protein